jgi:hypothetical protein
MTQIRQEGRSQSATSARLRLVAEVIKESFEHPNETSVIDRSSGKVIERIKDDSSKTEEKLSD